MKVKTTRNYSHANGYSSGAFQFDATTEDKKVVSFSITISEDATPDLMRLAAQDLHTFANLVEGVENDAGKTKSSSSAR